ncbi:hypothetical protein OG737_25605 [Streptomyces sp. NBC_00122]
METATSLTIGQFAEYLRGLTQRLDPGAGWYGEFLRRDPEGLRACLNGAAIPPWDVVDSLLRDLAAVRGEQIAGRETVYAARLRAAAVTAWDRLPGGMEELRTQYAAAAAQRADAGEALRSLTARLGGATDPAEADALARELSWTQDDAARAASRHEDISARLSALRAGAPGEAVRPAGPEIPQPPSSVSRQQPAPAEAQVRTQAEVQAQVQAGAQARAQAEAPVEAPVGRAEGRWLRGARRAGGARYAGSAAPGAPAFTPPPGHPDGDPAPGGPGSAPRGARFGTPEPRPAGQDGGAVPPAGPGGPGHEARGHTETGPGLAEAAAGTGGFPAGQAGSTRAVVGELIALRAAGRGGEAHALLCEIAAWPADRLPGLADQLVRAGLAADWATLLWEAASLPPERLAAAAAALGEAGREADCDRLLRQGVARPPGEIAEAALALGTAGRTREADALLGAFVRVRTAEEAAALARRDPQWFAPRLLQAAAALSGTRHRDVVHALRVAGIAAA